MTADQKKEVAARLLAGQTHRQIAADLQVPLGSVSVTGAAIKDLALIQDYRDTIVAQAKAYAEQAWPQLEASLRVLSDEQWLREHPSEAFPLASAHRVMAETLGRILNVVGPRD